MKFNSVRTGNYAQSAKAVTQASDQIFNAAMSGKPDFTSISKEAIKGRSLERRAVTKAEGDVATAGIKAFNQANQYKMKAETDKAVSDIKRPAKRMAGVVAGLGAISGAAIEMKASREAKAERAELRGMRESMDQKSDELAAASELRYQELIDRFTNRNSDNTGDSAVSNTSTTVTSPSTPTPSPSTKISPTSQKGFRADVYNYLTGTKGLSRNKSLGLMANIDRESSFQINPQGGDGGNSSGMFQWNNTYGRSQRMQSNVKDWQTNWQGQIDHALSGNQLPEYNQVTTDFLNTDFQSPQAAADYWMQNWERPAHQERDSKRHTEILGGYNF